MLEEVLDIARDPAERIRRSEVKRRSQQCLSYQLSAPAYQLDTEEFAHLGSVPLYAGQHPIVQDSDDGLYRLY